MKNRKELEDIEVKKYLEMLAQKGYGHTMKDVEKRVRSGIAIAHEINRQEKEESKFAYDKGLMYGLSLSSEGDQDEITKLREENSLLIKALEDMTKMYGRERGLLEINSLHPEYSRAKELLNNLKK